MALKGYRRIVSDETDYFFTDGQTGTRGGMACYNSGGSGAAPDDPNAQVQYFADPSGKQVAGLLLGDIVSKDLTQTHLNQFKNENITGGKCWLLRDGNVTTNMIEGTPTVGAPVYLGHSGYLSTTQLSAWGPASFGTFKSIKDQDGYAKVDIRA